jgi:PAS domain S-box-containing protein
LLAQAVELSPDGVLIVDDEGLIVYANRSIRELSGIDALVGCDVERLVPASAAARHRRRRHRYSAAPEPRPMGAGRQLLLQRADASTVPVEISLSPFHHVGASVIVTVREISDRLEAQRRLTAAHEQLALVAERERIGRDLHDVVLQHLYGMGLTAQAIAGTVDPATAERLERVVADVDRIISEVRTIVFTLGKPERAGRFGQQLADVVAEATRVLGFTPAMRLEGPVDSVLSDAIRTEMVASIREALGNVARHAHATEATVVVEIVGERVLLTVTVTYGTVT